MTPQSNRPAACTTTSKPAAAGGSRPLFVTVTSANGYKNNEQKCKREGAKTRRTDIGEKHEGRTDSGEEEKEKKKLREDKENFK